jgi:hypothetical protein
MVSRLGGPIIKNKLFYFASLEYKKNEYPYSVLCMELQIIS